jgi:hypothetical protein
MKGWVEHRDEEAKKQRWFNLELGVVISLSQDGETACVEVEKITGGVIKFESMKAAVDLIGKLVK